MAIRQKGNKWQVDVTVKGARAPRVSCDTRAEAQTIEAQFKAHLLAGKDPALLVPQGSTSGGITGTTLGTLVDATYAAQWRGTKSEENSLRNANAWCEALGYDYPVARLGPQEFADVVDGWAAEGLAAGTINRKIAALSVMLRVALERGWIEKKITLRRKKEYEGRLRYFTDDEVNSILDHVSSDPDMARLCLLAVETGMRQGELLGLTRRDVNTERGLIMLGETKGNKRRSVPLTVNAKDALCGLMRGKKDHDKLFPERINKRGISRVMAGWKAARGLPKDDEACFHTFRHTTCSRLIMAGVSPVVVQRWMGHATIQTTMRYTHLAPDALDTALRALNERNGN